MKRNISGSDCELKNGISSVTSLPDSGIHLQGGYSGFSLFLESLALSGRPFGLVKAALEEQMHDVMQSFLFYAEK